MLNYVLAFIIGGLVTLAITYLELQGYPTLSRLAALFPIFTWLSYLFIGVESGSEAVSKHAWFVLWGTLVSWVPYMVVIAWLAPKLGATKSIAIGLTVFLILALGFTKLYQG